MSRVVRVQRPIPIQVSEWVPAIRPAGVSSYAEAVELARTVRVPEDYRGGRSEWLAHLAMWARMERDTQGVAEAPGTHGTVCPDEERDDG